MTPSPPIHTREGFVLNPNGVPPTPSIPFLPLPSTPPPIDVLIPQKTSVAVAHGQSTTDRHLTSASTNPHTPLYIPSTIVPVVNQNLATIPVDMANKLSPTSKLFLCDPATTPPVQTLRLRSSLPWEIVVTASSYSYVTSWDVLQTLHQALRYQLTPVEMTMVYGLMIHSPTRTGSGVDEQEQRPRPHSYRGGPVCRIDTLCGRTVAHFTGPLVWDLGWVLSTQFLSSCEIPNLYKDKSTSLARDSPLEISVYGHVM